MHRERAPGGVRLELPRRIRPVRLPLVKITRTERRYLVDHERDQRDVTIAGGEPVQHSGYGRHDSRRRYRDGGGLEHLLQPVQIEARFTPQTGEESKPFWKGGAYGALAGSFGKVIAGRWWSQAFLKSQFAADPFGEATVGLNYGTVGCGGGSCVGAFWVNNSVSYENSFGPVSVGVQLAEKPSPGDKNPVNGGVSYAQGGLYVGLGYEKSGVDDSSWSSATVNYDFGAVKLYSGYGTGKDNAGASHRNAIVGFDVPVGDGHVIGAFDQHRVSSVTVTSKAALGYQYSLNKNAKLFATVANDSKAASDKTGYDVGMIYSW